MIRTSKLFKGRVYCLYDDILVVYYGRFYDKRFFDNVYEFIPLTDHTLMEDDDGFIRVAGTVPLYIPSKKQLKLIINKSNHGKNQENDPEETGQANY